MPKMWDILLKREHWFSWCWRIAVFLLPWQMRWFSDASLNGYPWEEGRWSVYGSWFFVVLTILLAGKPVWKKIGSWIKHQWMVLVLFVVLTFIQVLSHPEVLSAVMQWWIQVILLVFFVTVLILRDIERKDLAPVVLASLVPSCIYGISQVITQTVVGSSLLGVASRVASDAGASVVQLGTTRFLRAYGFFPHPNIFGGWLVLGFMMIPDLEHRKWRHFFAGLFGILLVLTFSRSAWIASAMVVFVLHRRPSYRHIVTTFVGGFVVASMMLLPIISSRLHADTFLEEKSISDRTTSIAQTMTHLHEFAWFGTGPNAEKRLIPEMREPPHLVPLLAFLNFGVLGCALIFWMFRNMRIRAEQWMYLLPITPCIFLDHYFWSYWAGVCFIGLFTVYLQQHDS